MYLYELQPTDPKFGVKEAYILNSLRRDRTRCEDVMSHVDKYGGFGAYKVLLQDYHQQMTDDEIIYYWRRAVVQLNSYLVYLIYKDCNNRKHVYNGIPLEEIIRIPDWTVSDWNVRERVEACRKYVHDFTMWNDVVIELWKEQNAELGKMNIKNAYPSQLQRKLKDELKKIAKSKNEFSLYHFVALTFLVYQKRYICKWDSRMEAFDMKGLVRFLGKMFSGEQLEQALEEVVYCFALYDTINYKMEELEPKVRKMKRELKRYLHS